MYRWLVSPPALDIPKKANKNQYSLLEQLLLSALMHLVPYAIENVAYFAITTLAWPIMLFIAARYTTDTNYFKEPGVGVPAHIRNEQEASRSPDFEMA